MWAFSSAAVTVCSIQPGRGFEQAAVVLGTEYDGFLVRDGWIVYRGFSQAIHQTCVADLLRRCREMMAVAWPGAAQFPATVKGILQAAIQLRDRRDRRDQGEIRAQGLAVACGAIRPMVVTRKAWGGNRTPRGAHTQSILVSILHTCRQQLRPAISVVARLLRSPKPEVLDLTAPDGFP